MFRRIALAWITVFALIPSPAQPASYADQAVEQFHRTCLAEGAHFDRSDA